MGQEVSRKFCPPTYMLYSWQELTGIPHSVDVGPQTTYQQ